MARYIVVEFDRNEDAEAFVQRLDDENKIRRDDRMPFVARVVGVFVKPGKTCGCSDWNRANYGDKNYKWAEILLGEKFGWWICSRCNKPRKGGHQLNNQLDMSATYEGMVYEDYEFCLTSVDITGIHKNHVDRPKKLRPKKVK